MSEAKSKPETQVDKKTAKGKGEGGFSPHPDNNDDFQGGRLLQRAGPSSDAGRQSPVEIVASKT